MTCLDGVWGGRMSLWVSMYSNAVLMPSSWGMLVYRDVTSAVTRMALGGRGGRAWMIWRRCLVSLR